MDILTSGNKYDGFTARVDLTLNSVAGTGDTRAQALRKLNNYLLNYADRIYKSAAEARLQSRIEEGWAFPDAQSGSSHVPDIDVGDIGGNGDKVSG